MRKKDIHIKLTDDEHQGLKEVAQKEKWSMCKLGEEAIRFYLKARRIFKE